MNDYCLRDKEFNRRQWKKILNIIYSVLVALLFFMRLTGPSLAMGAQSPNLIGLWQMNGDWTDASGNGNNGTASSGATFSTNALVTGQSGSFNGVSGYVQVMMTVPEYNFTIEAWAKTSNPGGLFSVNAGSFSGSTGSDRNFYVNSSGYACFYVWKGPAWCTNTYVADNNWHHWALVVATGVGQNAYIDGQLVGTNTYDHSDFNWPDRITIGYSYYGGYFNGLVDEVSIYNNAQTAAQINTSYNAGRYVALWHMDGDWTDATGNGNNGTATNAVFSTNARVGTNAGSFNGVSSSITGTTYSLPLGNAPRAISAWVQLANGTQSSSILQYGTGSSSNFQIFIDNSNRAAIGTDSGSMSGTSILSYGQWHFIVGVYEGTGTNTWRIYVDGVQENSGTITPPNTVNSSFSIGANIGGGGYFNGLIDEVTVYSRAITVNQITTFYNNGLGRFGLWHMDGDWTDASGNGNNGTAYSGATFSTNAQVGSQSGSFNGVAAYVMAGTGYISNVTNTFTIEFWANPAGTRAVTTQSNSGVSGTSGQQYAIGPMYSGSNGGAGVSVGTNGISVFEQGSSYMPSLLVYNAPLSGWNHIVVVYQNKQPSLYVNGQFVMTGLTSQRANVYPSTLFGNTVTYGPYDGLLEEVSIYNCALTAAEINTSYNAGRYVALWHMDGDWTDATGNGNNGTATNAVFSTNARVGTNAGSFDGFSASVNGTAYSLPLGNAPRAISAWVQLANGTQSSSILQYGTGSSSNFQIFIDNSNRAAIGTDSGSMSGTSILSDGRWHFVVGVYEGTSTNTWRIYVDDVQENSGTITPPDTVNGSFSIGANIGGGEYFNGLIDEVTVYDQAISTNQINTAYNSGLGRVGLWHMDGDWTDASGNGNNGTAYDGATFSTNAQVGSQSGSFNGVNSYVTAGSGYISSVTNTFTIEFWANPAGTRAVTTQSNSGISGMSGQQYAIGPMYSGTNGGAGVSVGTNGISIFEQGSSYMPSLLVYNAPLSGWNHIVVVYQNKQPSLYVNGQFVMTGLTSQRANVYPSTLFGNTINYGPYDGLLDEVSIYNRALTAAEINTSYNAALYVALWHMDGNWNDATGNGNNGTATNALFSTNARVGTNAGSFNGVSASVNGTAYSLPLGNAPRTLSAWIQTVNGTQNSSILQYGTGSASNFQIFLDSSNRAAIGTNSGSMSGTSILSDGQWHFVAGVYEGTGTNTWRIYVDGVQENSGTITPPGTVNGSFSIGANIGSGGYFNGLIDEAAVYNQAITAYQISIAYSSGLGRVGLWHMDGDWTDASGNGSNGTAYDGATFSTNAQPGNQSGSFNGVNSYVTAGAGYISTVTNTFTIAFWANPAATRAVTPEGNSGITGIGGQQYAIAPMYSYSNGGAGVSVGTNGISVFEQGSNYLPSLLVYNATLSGWNHIVVVYQNKQPSLYVNGQFVMTGLTSSCPNVYPSTIFGNVLNYGPYDGLLDEVSIYNRALSTQEIINLYTAVVPYVQIISPVPGLSNINTPLLNYTVLKGTVSAVKVDGNIVSTASGSNLNIVSDGTHTVIVAAVNSAGTMGFAQTSFTVDTVPPTVSINPVTSPTVTATQIITGTIESGATVTVSVNTAAVAGQVSYPTASTWSCTVTNLAWGSNIITATAFDAAGNSAAVNATIIEANINISNVTVSSNTLDVSAPNTVSIYFTISNPALITLQIISQSTGATKYQASQNCSATGAYQFIWNGQDNTGHTVPDGAYFYTLQTTLGGVITGSYNPTQTSNTDIPVITNISYSSGFDPLRNIPTVINYSSPTASICSLLVAVPYRFWNTVYPWAYTIVDSVPLSGGVNYNLEWDGRNQSGTVVAPPGLLIPGTSTPMDIFLQCSPGSLTENYIIISGGTLNINNVTLDPSAMQLSYGEFTRIKYHLSGNANVTITLTSPSGVATTLVSSQAQSVGDQEFDWNGLDPTDASGKKSVLSVEGYYTVCIIATNQSTGSNSTACRSLLVGF
jgi:flagellar hook assembly protein FlgD